MMVINAIRFIPQLSWKMLRDARSVVERGAGKEMLLRGKIHGYYRMYWGEENH